MSLNIDETYASSNFLKSADLAGKRVNVTIAGATLEGFKDGKKICLSFEGSDKRMVLNKTNARDIADLLQIRDASQWAGKTITLRPDKTNMQNGDRVDCIRVDMVLPAQKYQPGQMPAQAVAPALSTPAMAAQAPIGGMPIPPAADEIPF